MGHLVIERSDPLLQLNEAAFHRTLAMEELLVLFERELRTALRFQSFEFENPDFAQHFFRGVQQLHKCRYRLTVTGVPLGQVTLTRSSAFKEDEIRTFELALGALAVHLGNALADGSGKPMVEALFAGA